MTRPAIHHSYDDNGIERCNGCNQDINGDGCNCPPTFRGCTAYAILCRATLYYNGVSDYSVKAHIYGTDYFLTPKGDAMQLFTTGIPVATLPLSPYELSRLMEFTTEAYRLTFASLGKRL